MALMMKKRQTNVEKFIRRTPVTPWILAALATIPASLTLYARGRKMAALLVGLWTPTLLNASIYNRVLRSV